MADLRTALLTSGVIPERLARETEVGEQLEREERERKQRQAHGETERRMDILRSSKTEPATFRREAFILLTTDPKLIYAIIDIGHGRSMDEKKNQGGARLMVNLRKLKNLLAENAHKSHDERVALVRKNFHKR